MRTKKEIQAVLDNLDKEVQKMAGNYELSEISFRQLWTVRATLLWTLSKLENIGETK